MKKVLALMMAAVMALALAACGETGNNSSTEQTSSKAPESISSSANATTPESSKATDSASSKAAAATGKFKTIKDYLENEEVKQQLDATIKAMESTGLKMTITADGDKMIYTYTYGEQMPAEIGETLKSTMETQRSTMEGVASSLKLAVDVADPIVVVRYLNADGTQLAEIEFKAK